MTWWIIPVVLATLAAYEFVDDDRRAAWVKRWTERRERKALTSKSQSLKIASPRARSRVGKLTALVNGEKRGPFADVLDHLGPGYTMTTVGALTDLSRDGEVIAQAHEFWVHGREVWAQHGARRWVVWPPGCPTCEGHSKREALPWDESLWHGDCPDCIPPSAPPVNIGDPGDSSPIWRSPPEPNPTRPHSAARRRTGMKTGKRLD